MNPPRLTSKRRINALSVARVMVCLQRGPHTVHDLVDEVGLALATVRRYVLTLHSEGGCHVDHWEQDGRGRYSTPAYRIGLKRDATRPKQCNASRCKAYRTRAAQVRACMAIAGVA